MTLDPPPSRRLPLDTDRKMYRVGYHGDSMDPHKSDLKHNILNHSYVDDQYQ